MPKTDTIVWMAIAGLIVMMLGIIGVLLKTGFAGVQKQLEELWKKLDLNHEETNRLHLKIERIEARCDERHKD